MASKAKNVVDAIDSWSIRVGPMHERLSAAIQDGIRLGSLRPGMRLPAERHLASLLAVSRTTIVSAYNDLRRDGWIESRVGSGTWINREKACSMRGAARMASLAKSPILHATTEPEEGAIDLASAMTAPLPEAVRASLYPSEAHVERLLSGHGPMPFGLPDLRRSIAQYYSAAGLPTTYEEVLVTSGGQQAISIICGLLLHPGTPVLVENPTYYGTLEALRITGAKLYPIPVLKTHIAPTLLRDKLRQFRPKMLYVTPTGQTPTGAVMSEIDRNAVAQDCCALGTVIVEDETMADLVFTSRRHRSLAAFAKSENVLTVGSLSRIVWPNLRIGWIRGSKANIARLAKLKTAADLASSVITQSLAVEFLDHFRPYKQIRQKELLKKRNLLIDLLNTYVPDGVFCIPEAGLSLWLNLPGIDASVLAQSARRHGLMLSPGNFFSVDETHTEFLRIPFVSEPAVLEAGVSLLGTLYERATARSSGMRHEKLADAIKISGVKQISHFADALASL